MTTTTLSDFLSVDQAALELSMNAEYIRRQLRAGRISGAVQFSHVWLIPRAWVLTYKKKSAKFAKNDPRRKSAKVSKK